MSRVSARAAEILLRRRRGGSITASEPPSDNRLGRERLDGIVIAVQGLGQVGAKLCEHLAKDGARLTVTDIDADAVRAVRERHGATAVAAEEIYDVEADVLAPCALGAVLNDDTVPRLKATIVAGSANNQLAETHHGGALLARGILYAPDYVINAGGLIYVSYEIAYRGAHFDSVVALAHVARLHDRLLNLFGRADEQAMATNAMANRIAWERLEEVRAARARHRTAIRRPVTRSH